MIFRSPRLALALKRERVRQAGATAAIVFACLLALDLIGFVATVYYGAELVQAAEAAGVAGLLPR